MILPRYTLERVYLEKVTLGSIFPGSIRIEDNIIAKTLELPYRGNNISSDPNLASCIMEGITLWRREPPKESRPYEYFRCIHAPGRNWQTEYQASNVLMHPANLVEQLLGCISPGSRHTDINSDGVFDLVDSKKKLAWMVKNMPKYFELEIRKRG